MKYWKAKVMTPFMGEEEEIYFEAETEEHARNIAWDALVDNAYNWYDDDYYEDMDDCLEQCIYHLDEITKEEYEEEG